MKVVIVNCFDTYEERVDLVHKFFRSEGYDVSIVQSDFSHFRKVHRDKPKENYVFVKSKAYFKNLSLTRLYSHYKFASDAFRLVKKLKPDILYAFVPPNSLAKFAASYKQKHKNVKLIFDLIDLWPETMPIGRVKKIPPFSFWGELRDSNLKHADFVITECNLYQIVLKDALDSIKTKTIFLSKREINVTSCPQLSFSEIHLAYLGSINNIIDIPKIKEIIETINIVKPVVLHIIGDGESKQFLINSAHAAGAKVQDHGRIFDSQRKQDIFDKCNFGLNIMKDSVCVGLTMKSIDYFQHGLPIINNIPSDTAEVIEKYNVGVNVLDDMTLLRDLIVSDNSVDVQYQMRKNAIDLFIDSFSVQAFDSAFGSIFKE